MRKYWYLAVILSLVAAAGILLGVSTIEKRPDEFKLALVYTGDGWGEVAPCG